MDMTKAGREFYDNFTKDIYETIKGISDDDRGSFIINTYESLYGKLRTEEAESGSTLDLDALRNDLSQLRGIGGRRLDEIMEVIQKHLNKSAGEQKEPEKTEADENEEVKTEE